MTHAVLADAVALYAAADENDSLHERAMQDFSKLENDDARSCWRTRFCWRHIPLFWGDWVSSRCPLDELHVRCGPGQSHSRGLSTGDCQDSSLFRPRHYTLRRNPRRGGPETWLGSLDLRSSLRCDARTSLAVIATSDATYRPAPSRQSRTLTKSVPPARRGRGSGVSGC